MGHSFVSFSLLRVPLVAERGSCIRENRFGDINFIVQDGRIYLCAFLDTDLLFLGTHGVKPAIEALAQVRVFEHQRRDALCTWSAHDVVDVVLQDSRLFCGALLGCDIKVDALCLPPVQVSTRLFRICCINALRDGKRVLDSTERPLHRGA